MRAALHGNGQTNDVLDGGRNPQRPESHAWVQAAAAPRRSLAPARTSRNWKI
jgi:hypothetical protein